jgi:hypothetical protein
VTFNDDNNGKCKLEEEAAESSMARKRLWLSDDDDSFDSPEEEEEEISSEETSMNHLNTSKEKLFVKRSRGSDNGNTTSPSSEPRTPESHRCSNEDSSDEDNDDF